MKGLLDRTNRPRRAAAIYTGTVRAGRMVRPAIEPLPPDVWDEFVAALKRGPTPEQARAVERAMEIGNSITLKDSSIVKNKKICRPRHSAPHGRGDL